MLLLYFDEISSNCHTCVRFETIQQFESTQAKKLPVKIYDYYEPSFFAVEYYDLESTHRRSIRECNCYKECGYDGIPVW